MTYILEAVVGVEPVIRVFAADHPPAVVVPLPVGLLRHRDIDGWAGDQGPR